MPRVFLSFLVLLFATTSVCAHPLEEEVYDRTITVRLTSKAIVVEYVLEVDARFASNHAVKEMTLQEIGRVAEPGVILDRFVRDQAAPLAANLLVRLDGSDIALSCTSRSWKILDHLQCRYRFEANWHLAGRHDLLFREANFHDERGTIRLALEVDDSLRLLKQDSPKADQQRSLSANVERSGTTSTGRVPPPEAEPTQVSARSVGELFALLGVAFVLGAAHALTPGHGKTLVAAYLVGARGTIGHAVLLGIVTTLTHTGVILLIAAVLPLLIPELKLREMQQLLGFVGGLIVVALGFWLLQCRLAGRADHVHLGGGHHAPGQRLSLWGLIALGVTGGLVPCAEALALFVASLSADSANWAFFILLSFSVGLASVLVGIGLAVVCVRNLAVARWGEHSAVQRVVRFLPIVSAVVVTGIGLWLCYTSASGATH